MSVLITACSTILDTQVPGFTDGCMSPGSSKTGDFASVQPHKV